MADTPPPKPQIDKFRDLARELETDDDEARFDERLKKLTAAPARQKQCRHCGGSGKVPKATDIVPGPVPPPEEWGVCSACGGSGTATLEQP
jgi:DnaJ-class molecular chaperone